MKDHKGSEACELSNKMSNEAISKMVKVWGIGLDWTFKFGLLS